MGGKLLKESELKRPIVGPRAAKQVAAKVAAAKKLNIPAGEALTESDQRTLALAEREGSLPEEVPRGLVKRAEAEIREELKDRFQQAAPTAAREIIRLASDPHVKSSTRLGAAKEIIKQSGCGVNEVQAPAGGAIDLEWLMGLVRNAARITGDDNLLLEIEALESDAEQVEREPAAGDGEGKDQTE